jgi:hypothetical protein
MGDDLFIPPFFVNFNYVFSPTNGFTNRIKFLRVKPNKIRIIIKSLFTALEIIKILVMEKYF